MERYRVAIKENEAFFLLQLNKAALYKNIG